MTAVLRVVAVTHGDRGDRVPVLDGVDLEVGRGELVALVGRSGSGKSTLCQLAAGLEAPDAGDVLVAGARADRVGTWAEVSYQPQRLGLAAELSVRENALIPCWLADRPPAPDLLAGLGLEHIATRPAGQTSLGEQQRTGIARALAVGSRLVVLDEPTGHQDDAHLDLVLVALTAAARAGSAVLVATHDASVIAAADRAVHLDSGRVVPPRDAD